MRSEAIFLNGVFESVLQEILEIQTPLPEQILFLQPYSGSAIRELRDHPPTIDDPVRLFLSTTKDLSTVRYQAEIVNWSDKTALSDGERFALNRIIWSLQPHEHGLYERPQEQGALCVNLLHVRRMEELDSPFSVDALVKTSDDEPVSTGRTTAGGWTYVYAEPRK